MIAELLTYSPEDFIPFTAETYFQLIARTNEVQWPLQCVALLLGFGTLYLAWRGHGRAVALAVAIAWAWAGIGFHLGQYSELLWVASWFGWAFVLQGLLLVVCGLAGCLDGGSAEGRRPPVWLGYGLVGVGLTVYPLLAPITGHGWSGAECFGIQPDPTALVTLGLLLILVRGPWLMLLMPIPVLWCLISALTLSVLEAPWALIPAVAALAALVGAGWICIAGVYHQVLAKIKPCEQLR